MSIQFIADGRNGRDERVILWRTGEYTYELDIGSGIYKTNQKFYEIEYDDAKYFFHIALMTYRNSPDEDELPRICEDHGMKYQVMTEVSSFNDGRPLLHVTNSLAEAKRECREWAEYDDIYVWVEKDHKCVYSIDGYLEAAK